ncbi:MAG: molecular chaperone TorD family protein [Atopobiaceae bacterium]|nr:molecular chaperone TorD family protein [Atopobiaceae bacterium]
MKTLIDSTLAPAEAAAYRSAIYRLVSRAFMEEPSADYLRELAAMAQESGPEDAVLDCEAALLAHLAGYAGADFDDLRTKVATEYAELFVGPRHPLAGCYGSLYIGFPNRMFTESTRKVRKFYRAFGRMSDSPNRVPDDHIAYELEFMSYLCEQEASALERGADSEAAGMRAAQQTFAATYLASWTHPFADAVARAWCADYYAAWADFARDFVDADLAYLGTLPQGECRACA